MTAGGSADDTAAERSGDDASLGPAGQDLEQAAAILRQAVADGTVPPRTRELISRLEQLARHSRPQPPPESDSVGPEGHE